MSKYATDTSGFFPYKQMGFQMEDGHHIDYYMEIIDEESAGDITFDICENIPTDDDGSEYVTLASITIKGKERLKFAGYLREVANSIEKRIERE